MDLCKNVKKYFDNHSSFNVIGIAHDGVEGLNLMRDTNADVALIDIVMPQKDGISILEELKLNPDIPKPICIMLTAVSHEGLTKKALELGADYFVLKPFDLDILARRMLDIYNHKFSKNQSLFKSSDDNTPNEKPTDYPILPINYAADILQKIGIPSNLNGYSYLKSAITLAIEDKSMLSGITKILYPNIAKICNTTSVRVERSIRHAIEASWSRGYEEAYKLHVGYSSPEHEKPTNSYLISLAVEKYHLLNL